MSCKIEERLSRNINSTSEAMFGFPSQPEPQCPIIDNLIKTVKEQSNDVSNAVRELRGIDEVNSYTLSDLENVDYELRTLDIEQLRNVITNLRNWGQAWKDFAKDLVNDNDIDIEKYI